MHTFHLILSLVMTALCLRIVQEDLSCRRIRNRYSVALLSLTIALHRWRSFSMLVLDLLLCLLLYLAIYLISRGGLGAGDLKLSIALAPVAINTHQLLIGHLWAWLLTSFLIPLDAIFRAVLTYLPKGGRSSRSSPPSQSSIPFAPGLIGGVFLATLWAS